jgi:hypothetical protein
MLKPISHVPNEAGVALVVVLFALSVFSALTATVLTDAAVENDLLSGVPGAQVALSTSEIPSQIAGPSNVAAPWRLVTTRSGRFPLMVGMPLPDGFNRDSMFTPSGWSYAVGLASGLRVCCDGGDGKCARDAAADQQTYAASVNPVLPPPNPGGAEQRLLLDLATSVPSPTSETASANIYSVKATVSSSQAPPGDVVPEQTQAPSGSVVACMLENQGTIVAKGTMHLRRVPRSGVPSTQADWLSEGTLDLTYRR